jgi:hypothetical protein
MKHFISIAPLLLFTAAPFRAMGKPFNHGFASWLAGRCRSYTTSPESTGSGSFRIKVHANDDLNIAMDIYSPLSTHIEKLPAVIFIHGGARAEWTPKDWGIYKSWGRLIAASGFVAVTFTHRLEYPNRTLDAGRDVGRHHYVRSNADKYNVDKERICSSLFQRWTMLSLALRGDTPYINAFRILLLMDIWQSNYNKSEGRKTKALSPITYLEKDPRSLPAMFIARAGLDESRR